MLLTILENEFEAILKQVPLNVMFFIYSIRVLKCLVWLSLSVAVMQVDVPVQPLATVEVPVEHNATVEVPVENNATVEVPVEHNATVEVHVEHNAMEGLNATLLPFNAAGKRSTQLFICIPLYLLQ